MVKNQDRRTSRKAWWNMDRQQLERKEIPVNARAVGTPTGMNVLYLEDYVHTFIKKLVKSDEEENGCEVFLYGYEFDEDGRHFLIVSGAYEHNNRRDIPEKIGAQYFPQGNFLGTADIHSDGVSEMNMEIIKEGVRSIVLKNFYIYYDQNEEMQNYLIEWNLEHREYRNRSEFEGAVKYGRIAQAQNKEEVRVSFMWNVMNVLSLGFIVCIMVYGILCMNNYHKMKDMEDKLAYIMTNMSENGNFVEASSLFSTSLEEEKQENAEVFQTEIVETVPEETSGDNSSDESKSIESSSTEIAETIESTLATEAALVEQQIEEVPETIQSMTEVSEQSVQSIEAVETTNVPQYYVVQQGDTLRSICISVYGNCDRVEEVCTQNGITDPNSILCGQTLLLP